MLSLLQILYTCWSLEINILSVYAAELRGTEENEARMFVALFPYDPSTMSPNPDAAEEELPFKEGQIIKVKKSQSDDSLTCFRCLTVCLLCVKTVIKLIRDGSKNQCGIK